MKNNRNGQAETLTEEQLEELFGVLHPNHKFAVCHLLLHVLSGE